MFFLSDDLVTKSGHSNFLYKRNQAGFTMIEITLALAISAFVAFTVFRSRLTESTQQSAQVQADQLVQLRDALKSFASINGESIVKGAAVTGVSNALQPTVAELQNLQLLPTQFKTLSTLNNSPFVTSLSVAPTGCALGACVISGYVYIRDPFLAKGDDATQGQYDGVTVSTMLSRIGGDAFARVVPSGSLVASGGNFTIANSAAVAHPTIKVNSQPYPAGVVGVRIASVTPAAPAGTTSTGTSGAPCPGGTINNVEAFATGGNGNGNQCFFTYPTIVLGSSATVLNTQTSTIGSLTVMCLSLNGNSSIQIANLSCVKK